MKEIILLMYSLLLAFRQNLLVFLSGLIVSFLGCRFLLFTNLLGIPILRLCLLLPALIDGLQAPLGRALASTDRLVAYEDKHRVGVTGGKDPQANPAALLDGHFKSRLLFGAVGFDFFFVHSVAVDHNFDGNFPRGFDP